MLSLNRRLCMAWSLASWPVWSGRAGAQAPWLEVVTGQGGVYDEAVAALRQALPGVTLVVNTRVSAATPAELPRGVLTLGVQALRDVLSRSTEPGWQQVPVLAGLLPQAAYALHAQPLPSGSSAVWLDQPLERWLGLIQLVWPEHARVGVLMGPATAVQAAELARAARQRNRQWVQSPPVNSAADIYPALSEVLRQVDVLLALPDPLVFNAGTMQNILQAAYRQRVPLISYSGAHVQAGATLGLYTLPAQAGVQMAQAARLLWNGAPLPRPAPAQDFTVAINGQVARSLGLNLPDASALAAALRRMEARR